MEVESPEQVLQNLCNITNISSHSKVNCVGHKIVSLLSCPDETHFMNLFKQFWTQDLRFTSFLSHIRTLREKTTLAVTSRGRFGTEDEKAPVGTSSRRRLVPRNLATITVGGSESIMVQALRLEELQRAKDEKR